MKKKCKYANYFYILFIVLLFTHCNQLVEREVNKDEVISNKKTEIYYCPMHPKVVQNKKGKCPEPECMGMDLILKVSDDALNSVLKPVTSSVLSIIKTINPIEKEVSSDFDVQGYIDYDTQTQHNIASRYNGRIEKLYIKYEFQLVKKGDKVFDIYSPDLVTAQENLIYVINTDPQNGELISATKQKLKLLGFTDEQTSELTKTKKIQRIVSVYSKWDGHIHEMINNPALSDNNGMTAMEGGESTNPNNQNTNLSNNLLQTNELSVKEGMYVSRGQTIFNIVNPHNVIAILQIRAKDISKLKINQLVEIVIGESKVVMNEKINFIEPFIKPNSKTLMARVTINNNAYKYKIGTLVKATLKGENTEGLFVPVKAVIDLGKEKIVWLKKDGQFIATKIETGLETNNWIEIYDGITKNDEIAIDAHYLNDSESFIKIINE